MPLTPPGLVAALVPNLLATGNIGPAVPQLAQGIAAGVILWSAQVQVTSVDTGTLGAGVGTIPLVVPPPLLLGTLLAAMTSQGMLGPTAPLFATGVSNGLATGFAQGLVLTTHPSVGTGTGICKFAGSSAIPSMIEGFATAGMTGTGAVKMATAIGTGIDTAFAAFVLPTPIVGSASPAPSAGVGTGKIG